MRLRRRFGSRRGNAMIEFALSAMVLTYSFTAVFQFGYSMYLYNELVGAVRAGARYASLAMVSNDGSQAVQSAYTTAVQNMVVYGNTSPAQGDQAVVPGLTTGQVNITPTFPNGTAPVPSYMTVSINSYSIDAVFKTYTLTGKPSLKVPFMGKYCLVSATTC
jgi:Flp pilus assembly protein TadG